MGVICQQISKFASGEVQVSRDSALCHCDPTPDITFPRGEINLKPGQGFDANEWAASLGRGRVS